MFSPNLRPVSITTISFSKAQLMSFGNFLRFDFLNGFDILKYTLTDTNLLYIVVAQSLDIQATRKLLGRDHLIQALDFYECYGTALGMRTLYDFVETYYRCSISAIGLARSILPSWYFPCAPHASFCVSPTFSQTMENCNPVDQNWSMAQYQQRCLGEFREKLSWELNSMMNKPIFEVFNLRKWAMERISHEGINFKTFQSLVLASYWFQDRDEILNYFAKTHNDEDGNAAHKFLEVYTSKDIAEELEMGKISATRFADVFPDILVMALIGCDASMTGARLARHLFMCAIDLTGNAKYINSTSLMRMCKRQTNYKRKVLLERKVSYLSECWSPRIKLLTRDLVEWNGSYTVQMLDEYIDMMRATEEDMMRHSFETYLLR